MEPLFNAIFLILIILVALVLLYILSKEFFPYHKKKRLLSKAEQDFFKVLEMAVGDIYYIFPKIQLSNLLAINKEAKRERHKYFYKIAQKSVDFVLCDKQITTPVLAVELNETPEKEKSPARLRHDQFIKKAFKAANLPLLKIEAQESYDVQEIKEKILKAISETSAATSSQ